jgi:hypothetical protein
VEGKSGGGLAAREGRMKGRKMGVISIAKVANVKGNDN